MPEFIRHLITGKDNQTTDVVRVLAVLSFLVGLGLTIYAVGWKGQPFDLREYGVGLYGTASTHTNNSDETQLVLLQGIGATRQYLSETQRTLVTWKQGTLANSDYYPTLNPGSTSGGTLQEAYRAYSCPDVDTLNPGASAANLKLFEDRFGPAPADDAMMQRDTSRTRYGVK